jgi:hypothetical protein
MLKVSRSVMALTFWAVPTVAASDPMTIDLFRFASIAEECIPRAGERRRVP